MILLLLFESVCVREYAWALCICSNGTVGTFGYLQHFCFRGPQQLRANASDRERCIERLLLTRHKKQKNHRRWGYETTLSSLNIHFFFALPLCAVTSPCYMTKYDNANCTDGRGTSTVLVSGLAITVTSSWRLAAARPSHCGVNVRVCCISYADSICYSFFFFCMHGSLLYWRGIDFKHDHHSTALRVFHVLQCDRKMTIQLLRSTNYGERDGITSAMATANRIELWSRNGHITIQQIGDFFGELYWLTSQSGYTRCVRCVWECENRSAPTATAQHKPLHFCRALVVHLKMVGHTITVADARIQFPTRSRFTLTHSDFVWAYQFTISVKMHYACDSVVFFFVVVVVVRQCTSHFFFVVILSFSNNRASKQ